MYGPAWTGESAMRGGGSDFEAYRMAIQLSVTCRVNQDG